MKIQKLSIERYSERLNGPMHMYVCNVHVFVQCVYVCNVHVVCNVCMCVMCMWVCNVCNVHVGV